MMKKNSCIILLTLGGFTLIGIALLNSKGLREQAAYLKKQREISRIILPPETIIYTENPARFHEVKPGELYTSYAVYRDGMPEAMERKLVSHMFEGHFSDSAKVVNRAGSFSFGQKMSSYSGEEWIVLLGPVIVFPYNKDEGLTSNRAPPPGGGYRTAMIGQSTLRPVGWDIGSRGTTVTISGNKMLLGPEDQLTVWAPKPTHGDNSKVIMQYELNGEKGLLEGVLNYDGKVYFSIVSGPVKMLIERPLYKTEIFHMERKAE